MLAELHGRSFPGSGSIVPFHCGFVPQSAPDGVLFEEFRVHQGREKKMGLLKEQNNRRLSAP